VFQGVKLKKLVALFDNGSESQAARNSGVSQTTISELIRGQTTSPHQQTVAKLSARYGVHESYWYNENSVLPNEVPGLPEEMVDSLMAADFKPYLILLPEIKKQGIPPEILSRIVAEWSKT
jgi:transcriptional regulator with XRE-family HTH domain